jgi:hypothetical protein
MYSFKSSCPGAQGSKKNDHQTAIIQVRNSEGAPLKGLAAEEAFAYLGVRASLVGRQRRQGTGKRRGQLSAPCLSAEKGHILSATTDMTAKIRRHNYLLSQMVPAMHMVAT